MKKIIIGILSLTILFTGGSVFANSIWNTASNDCKTIAIANYTTNTGYTNPCWPLSTVNANKGDSINIRVYYHNTSTQNATNTRVIINTPTNSSTTHTFSGQILSDQGSVSFGPVSVHTSGNSTLTLGGTHWLPNQTQSDASLLSGQSGAEVINGGLSIGTIAEGWSAQGSVVIAFTVVEDTVAPTYDCTISNFTVNGSSSKTITSGNNAYLVWSTNNCNYVNISGVGTNLPATGSKTIYPTTTTTYNLTANGTSGGYGISNPSKSVVVFVNNYNNYNYNNNNYNNNNYNNYNYQCSISNFSSNQTQVNSGSPVTITWNTNNCNNVNITNIGNLSTSGSKIIYPTSSTTYILNASGYRTGTETRSIYVSVNKNTPARTVYNSCAVTTIATNINKNGATLNGLITSSDNNSNNNYFEYGKTVNFGLSTEHGVTNGSTSFHNLITNLTPNTIYYFRIVSDCQGGINKGATKIFQTDSLVSPVRVISKIKRNTKVISKGSTFSESTSSVMLKIENKYKSIDTEDIIDYIITYKNLGKDLLVNTILQVIVPKGITVTNTSNGIYSEDTKTLTVDLDDIKGGEEGVLYVQAQVSSLLSNTSQVVSTAMLVYTNKNKAQENAIAYVLNTVKEVNSNNGNSSLGAAALFGSFGSIGLIGFLLSIIFILIIILILRKYFYRGARVIVHK